MHQFHHVAMVANNHEMSAVMITLDVSVRGSYRMPPLSFFDPEDTFLTRARWRSNLYVIVMTFHPVRNRFYIPLRLPVVPIRLSSFHGHLLFGYSFPRQPPASAGISSHGPWSNRRRRRPSATIAVELVTQLQFLATLSLVDSVVDTGSWLSDFVVGLRCVRKREGERVRSWENVSVV